MLEKHQLTIDSTTVYYWQRNPEKEKTVVIIHGFRGDHKALTDFSRCFDGFRVIMLDLPGYGISDRLPVKHTIKNYAKFLDKFFNQLNLERINLVGYSYGGSISMLYASEHPENLDHLILISPAVSMDSLSQTLAKIQLKFMNLLSPSWQRKMLTLPIIDFLSTMSLVKTVSRKRKLELMREGIKNTKYLHTDVITECLSSFLTTPISLYARKINCPTLILAGEVDVITPLNMQVLLGEWIPLSRIKLMPKMGHLSPIERPKMVANRIVEFINHKGEQFSHVHQVAPDSFVTHPRRHKVIPVHTQIPTSNSVT